MSTAEREEKIRGLLSELIALSNAHGEGSVMVHASVNVALPVPRGAKLVFGALQGGTHLDNLLSVDTVRRLGMGTYRVCFGLFPERPPALASVPV